MAVRTKELMKEKKDQHMRLSEILRAVDRAVPEGVNMGNCTEVFAALIVLTD